MVNQKGYTLIELTIVVGLVAILAIGISSVVLMNTITANRTRNQTRLRTTGNYSLNQIKGLVRNAKSIDICDEAADSLTLTNFDGGTTNLSLELNGGVERIASNSGTYLSPADVAISDFTLTCLPTADAPNLIKISFSSTLSDRPAGRENPVFFFETSVTLRNN